MRHKQCLVIVWIFLLILLTGCRSKIIETDLEDYLHFQAPAFSDLELFPAIELVKGTEHIYRYGCASTFLFDDQIFYLNCVYGKEQYQSELRRLEAMDLTENDDLFELSARILYITDNSFEYVLLNQEEYRMIYIAAQGSDFSFCDDIPKEFLP